MLRTLLASLIVCSAAAVQAAEPLKILFLGDNGGHRPSERFHELEPVLSARGIELRYTDDPGVLNLDTLQQFDGLLVYANHDRIAPAAAEALLAYVESGKAFIPIHSASFCFRNDPRIVALIGAQFMRHGGQEFTTEIAEPDHPLMKGFRSFRSWDETYIHTLHNPENRTVLEYRVEGEQAEGRTREPWTWTRTHGKGRVFYTAWGHDSRTWTNPGFQNLLERGIRWACYQDPQLAGEVRSPGEFPVPRMTALPDDKGVFEYVDVGPKIPNYTPGQRWGEQGAPKNLMQVPLPAEKSLQRYSVPEGFSLQLFASEELFGAKPIAMNWDERGRLWVCGTIDYPNELAPGNQGRDRIEILEDTTGDGRADKLTVFAEHLSIPAAILPLGNGCIVQNGTETLWLADADGDGRADIREVLMSNWALGDTHGGVSNFRLGLDNWVYGMQGYNNSAPVINGERQQSFRMGFFRFKLAPIENHRTRVTALEFLRSTNNNTWGLGISEEGIIFGSTANHCPSVYLPIPNRYYERVRGWSPQVLEMISDTHLFNAITNKIRQVDQFGGYTAGCGHALYTARNYPEAWWNRVAFVCEPTGHLVGTFVLNPQGADFKSTSPFNLVASDDEWAAPIMAEVGPDGNVWVLDWYNFIVQHNPTPHGFETGRGNAYESDLRDKRHGRVYRLVNNAQPGAMPVNLLELSPQELVTQLKSPTMLVRLQAQRLLIQQADRSVVPALWQLIADQSVDPVGLNVGAIHALWVLDGMGLLDQPEAETWQKLAEALEHPSAGVRRNALQVLPSASRSVAEILDRGLLQDPAPQVRLAAMLALADQEPDAAAAAKIVALLGDSQLLADRWLADGLTSAASVNAAAVLTLAAQSELSNPEALKILGILAEHVARGKPTARELEPMVVALPAGKPAVVTAILEGWNRGWSRDHQLEATPAIDAALLKLLDTAPQSSQANLIRLASFWGSKELEKHVGQITGNLLAIVRQSDSALTERVAAIRQLLTIRPDDSAIVEQLLDMVTPQSPPEFSGGVLEALTASTAEDLGQQILNRWRTLTPAAKQVAIRTLLARPASVRALLNGLESREIQLTELSLDQQRSLGEHPDRGLRARARALLAAGGGLPNADRQKVIEDLLAVTETKGDVENGLAMYKKHCMKCHKHGDLGENIGPNLTGMAVHPKTELLIHIMDPSRSVEGNFRMYQVVTVEGRLFTGMLASETRTAIELIDAEAKRHALQREDIEELVSSPKSLMPEGFEKQMTPEEVRDLLEFLTNKGKYLPLDLRKVANINSTQPMFHRGNFDPERLIFSDWNAKTFNGVPFLLIDPQGDRVPNVLMLRGRNGDKPPGLITSARVPVNAPAKTIHLLGGIGGWAFPAVSDRTPVLRLRLHYADGTQEDHDLLNGVHVADYIRRVDVPGSEFAFAVRNQQIRYVAVQSQRPTEVVKELEFIKPNPNDVISPITVAVTVETE